MRPELVNHPEAKYYITKIISGEMINEMKTFMQERNEYTIRNISTSCVVKITTTYTFTMPGIIKIVQLNI
jgi:hypothetical protein